MATSSGDRFALFSRPDPVEGGPDNGENLKVCAYSDCLRFAGIVMQALGAVPQTVDQTRTDAATNPVLGEALARPAACCDR
eukprot:7986252-Pyramimonas_sp.AAC.1